MHDTLFRRPALDKRFLAIVLGVAACFVFFVLVFVRSVDTELIEGDAQVAQLIVTYQDEARPRHATMLPPGYFARLCADFEGCLLSP